jgi:DNA-binding response OmpR family regulator
VKLLIAEDDMFFRRVLKQVLAPYYEVIAARDGDEAWATLQLADAPRMAILDWVMPGLSGPQVCRNVRQSSRLHSMYLIILTAKNNVADIVSGLRAGADDYVTKPFNPEELRARVTIGKRMLELNESLAESLIETNESLAREQQLQKMLLNVPCRRRPNLSQEDWPGVEAYLSHYCEPEDSNSQGSAVIANHPAHEPANKPSKTPHE